MSASELQEDVAMSNKDAETNDKPAPKTELNEGSGDSYHLAEHSDIELAKQPRNTTDIADNLKPLLKTSTEEAIPVNTLVNDETGYKETVIDDTVDADIKLHWTDDEEEQNSECPALSKEALKQLDEELGIGEITGSEIQEKTVTKVDKEISNLTNQKIITQDTVLETSKMEKDDSKPEAEHMEALPESVAIITKSHKEIDQETKQDDEGLEKIDEKSSQSIDRLVSKQTDKSADQTPGEESTGIDKNIREIQELINQEDKLIDQNKMINDANEDSEAMDIDSSETENKDLITTDGDAVSNVAISEFSCKTSADEVSDIKDSKTNSSEKDIRVPAEVQELETVKNNLIIEAEPKALIKSDNKNIDTEKNDIIEPIENEDINSKPDSREVTHNEIVVEESVIDANIAESNNSSVKINNVNTATETDNIGITSENNKVSNHSVNESTKVPQTDITNSIQINTEHKINRPNVMLDIPTQEFDFDDDLDDSLNNQAEMEKHSSDNMTSRTVADLVNQLSKDIEIDSQNEKIEEDKHISTDGSITDTVVEENVCNSNAQSKITSEQIIESGTESTNITDKIEQSTVENASKIKESKQKDITNDSQVNQDKTISTKDPVNVNPTTSNDNETKIPKSVNVKIENEIVKLPTPGAKLQMNIDESSISVVKTEKQNDDIKPSTSEVKTEIDDAKPSTSEVKTEIDDAKPSTSEVKTEIDDAKPSTSDVKPTSDSEAEVPDSLSLLAESSRVMNDDEDDEQEPEDEPDGEGGEDDDDDFDPDEEGSSNQMTSGSEESNPAHSELDIQEEGIDIVYGNDGDSMMATDSTDTNDEFGALKAKAEDPATTNESESQTTKPNLNIISKLLKQDDTETKADSKSQNKTKPGHQKVLNIVDLESSEDDDAESKQAKEQIGTPKVEKEVLKEPKDKVDDEKTEDKKEDKIKVEVFNLDSDEDEKADNKKDVEATERPADNRCINYNCTSDSTVPYYMADRITIAYYGGAVRRKRAVCQRCLDIVTSRNEGLVAGIKDDRPLMSLRMCRATHQPLEISDSDSEDEEEALGEAVANILGDKLTDLFNETWLKYNMDDRIKDTEAFLNAELEKMQKEGEEIDKLLSVCQTATDKLRLDFYSSFEPSRKDLPAISIHDTPIASYACLESEEQINEAPQLDLRYPKRRSTSTADVPAKKQALASTDGDKKMTRVGNVIQDGSKFDDDKDISVVRLSVEAAPSELPPHGDIVRPPLKVGVEVYGMKNQYGAWLKGRVLEILPKTPDQQFSQARIRFNHNVRNPCKVISARSLAYTEPAEVRMTIGTRVIALFQNADPNNKRDSFYYSGVIAEIPNPVNNYRYLIFFDDGYVQYVHHKHTRLVYESSALVWEEVHPYSREFVSNYLMKYPERPMVRMHRGQSLTVEWNDKWWDTIVTEVDAALVKVHFPNNRIEWIYRGSTRLQPLFSEFQAARRGDRARLPRSTKANTNINMPYVEYTRSEESVKNEVQQSQTQIDELRRQRAVAKKSTALPQPAAAATDVVSRVVFYTPKNSVRPYKMVPHRCGLQCNRTDLLSLKDLRTYNPLTKPLLSGWERLTVRHKYCRDVMYRAPCGRRLRNIQELHRYLRAIDSELSVDLFDFNVNTHCLAEFVLNKTNVQKKDLSHGKENVPVPCVNYYDHSLPEFCSYNTERTPTAGVPLNLDPDFLCGCDCEDDCVDKTKCACWKMTLEGARTIGMEGNSIGYEYRRLPEPLPSGIYECNSRCKCKSTCLNRVVQHPLQLKLQVFKTLNRGWGIRALNDVPKGAFLCIYAGNLLTDATANLDGLNEGDEYLAELDYIEVVESMKEGYEDDIPEADKKLDKKELKKTESEEETEEEESEEEDRREKNDEEDGDFQPVSKYQFIPGSTQFNKMLRRRDKKKIKEEAVKEEKTEDKEQKNDGEDCITISDDEEVRVSQREPSRFTAQANMNDSKVIPKYRSIRTYFGKDEACYIMDAKVQGNIGRYLNHSCSPNVFVQNVFVDTHDPRFPWVSFFALHHIRAGTELTWNYNYDIGSVPGKVLYCFCGAPNCRGRLL